MDKFEEKQASGESKFIRILSVLAAVMAVAMYVAYIDQIQKTWGDATGPWLQPFVAGINCSLSLLALLLISILICITIKNLYN